jgi:hypothetical protein
MWYLLFLGGICVTHTRTTKSECMLSVASGAGGESPGSRSVVRVIHGMYVVSLDHVDAVHTWRKRTKSWGNWRKSADCGPDNWPGSCSRKVGSLPKKQVESSAATFACVHAAEATSFNWKILLSPLIQNKCR